MFRNIKGEKVDGVSELTGIGFESISVLKDNRQGILR